MYTGEGATEDVWLARLDRWACLVVRGAVLGLILLLVVGLSLVFHEMLSAEWRLKAAKLKLDQTFCHGGVDLNPHEFQDVCVPARQVLDRNAYVKAAEATGEWCVQRLPFVGYCRAHPDMCMLWGTKLVDVFAWLPMLLPMLAPVLAGLVWKLLTKPCRRPSSRRPVATSPEIKQIEGLKTE
jgi:hypothetical protein